VEARQDWMKSCRRGFMRWRGREGPWGSHQEEARAEKWEISVALTEEEVEGFGGAVELELEVEVAAEELALRCRDGCARRRANWFAARPAGSAMRRSRWTCFGDGCMVGVGVGWLLVGGHLAVPRGTGMTELVGRPGRQAPELF
jgi:hypothetical protein